MSSSQQRGEGGNGLSSRDDLALGVASLELGNNLVQLLQPTTDTVAEKETKSAPVE